ncbi:hypothetical protein GIX45_07860 [Erwinia sp. CPCC 100877]|nr:hypothetical protein [Erwinia sp. CPCC 100877]
MRELNKNEVEMVSGAWSSSLCESLEGGLYGLGSGIATGMSLGGINTKSDGLGFGILAQLAGVIVGGITGAILGGVGGLAFGKTEISKWVDNYTSQIGK